MCPISKRLDTMDGNSRDLSLRDEFCHGHLISDPTTTSMEHDHAIVTNSWLSIPSIIHQSEAVIMHQSFPNNIVMSFTRVDSFRCYEDMVVVKCTSDETFYFGHCKGEIIMKPRQVEVFRNARDVFVKAEYPGTGGLVCMGACQYDTV